MSRRLLTVAHRVCPALSKAASGYADKFSMVRDCSASLLAALKGVDVRLVVILDGCGDEYAALFSGAEIVRTDSIGNQATFAKQMEILCAADSEFVYFSEDDYLYRPEAFAAMLQFMSGGG